MIIINFISAAAFKTQLQNAYKMMNNDTNNSYNNTTVWIIATYPGFIFNIWLY